MALLQRNRTLLLATFTRDLHGVYTGFTRVHAGLHGFHTNLIGFLLYAVVYELKWVYTGFTRDPHGAHTGFKPRADALANVALLQRNRALLLASGAVPAALHVPAPPFVYQYTKNASIRIY